MSKRDEREVQCPGATDVRQLVESECNKKKIVSPIVVMIKDLI